MPPQRQKTTPPGMTVWMGFAAAFAALIAVIFQLTAAQRRWGIERETPAPTDVLLVSFPKSGSNWVRFLTVGLVLPDLSKLSFVFAEKLIPDLEYGPSRQKFEKTSRLAWKSHQPYRERAEGGSEQPRRCGLANMEAFQCLCPNCPKRWSRILYLARDGRSVLCSYYHQQTQLRNFEGTFDEFLASNKSKYGVAWPDHVASYLDLVQETAANVLVVKYEDLHAEPDATLRAIAEWYLPSESFSDDKLHDVLDAASFDNMRRLEAEHGIPLFDAMYPDARDAGGFHLVREGRVDGWRRCANDSAFFDDRVPGFRDVMTRLGYY